MTAQSAPESWEHTRRVIVRNALSIGLAVATYGVSFGALGTTSGLTVAQTCALSILMFTGGSQFALVSTIAAGGTGMAGIAAATLLGTRNAAYAMRLGPILNSTGFSKIVASQLTIDESTAMALAQDETTFEGRASRLGFWATGLSVFVLWNLATLLGALAATTIGDPKTFGLDAAIAAGLFALVWPQIKTKTHVIVACGAALIALATTPILSPGLPVLAASIIAFVFGYAQRNEPT